MSSWKGLLLRGLRYGIERWNEATPGSPSIRSRLS